MKLLPHRLSTQSLKVVLPLILLSFTLRCGSADSDASGATGIGGTGVGGSGGSAGGAYDGGMEAACKKDDILCEGDIAWRCDSQGASVDPVDCSLEGKTCVEGLGCANCVPGATSCANDVGAYCMEDGSSEVSFPCDPMQGLVCDPEGCLGACTPQKLGRSHVGCDFWPTVTANSVWRQWFPFGVMVVNTTNESAELVVTRGDETIAQRSLAPSGVEIIELPWVDALKGPDADKTGKVIPPEASVVSRISEGGGAYRLRSTQPVTVTQFNTLRTTNPEALSAGCPPDVSTGECLSYSNDASLLFPSTSLDKSHIVMGWKAWQIDSGTKDIQRIGDFISISAVEDDTKVVLTPRSPVLPFQDNAPIEVGKPIELFLDRGDVFQLFTDATEPLAQWSGSEVLSNHPIQIVTGAPCANVPSAVPTCDHIEETNLPRSVLGRRYLVTAPTSPSGRMRHIVRIHGVENETLVAFDPPSAHKSLTINQGEARDLDMPKEPEHPQDFLISSTKAFGVTQYMVGNQAEPYSPSAPDADLGDPSQTFVVPISRYLNRYTIALPPEFTHHRLDIVAATGVEVLLNDEPIEPGVFEAIGASGLSVARVTGLESAKRHELRSSSPFGLQVYGFGKFTSYMVPGGVDMRLPSQ